MYDCTDALLGVEKVDDEDWGLGWSSRGQSLGHENHDRVWGWRIWYGTRCLHPQICGVSSPLCGEALVPSLLWSFWISLYNNLSAGFFMLRRISAFSREAMQSGSCSIPVMWQHVGPKDRTPQGTESRAQANVDDGRRLRSNQGMECKGQWFTCYTYICFSVFFLVCFTSLLLLLPIILPPLPPPPVGLMLLPVVILILLMVIALVPSGFNSVVVACMWTLVSSLLFSCLFLLICACSARLGPLQQRLI